MIEGHGLKLIEWLALNYRRFLRHDERRSHRPLAAQGIARPIVDYQRGRDFLAAETRGIDRDSRRAGAADDARVGRPDRPRGIEWRRAGRCHIPSGGYQ